MTISQVVQNDLFASEDQQLIRIPLRSDEGAVSRRRRARREKEMKTRSKRSLLLWTTEEHARFLEALEFYPSGPWKIIAEHVGTRTTRQVMTHAQKYRQKIERRKQKQVERSTAAASQSQGANSFSSTSSMGLLSDPVSVAPNDAQEHAILLDFLDNFQPSEIDHSEPLTHTQDSAFLLDIKP
ncbi:hypothetical protein PHYBOEH_008114 [Phytophthora boehmeriae]|uniref:Myb-like DNA-binding protein n=1 Tax=Phytophthora boehmeriae TaxID=109152 RepID=A0A8T1W6Q4_9STRA|nr:hypothetical protein PHYBOEH_008114 [Phytophthora boehmeriae]